MLLRITPRSHLFHKLTIGAIILAVLFAIAAVLLAFGWPFTSKRVTRSWEQISFTHRISQLRLEGVQVSVPAHFPPPVRRGANESIKTTVTELVAGGAVLRLLPSHPGSTPLRFDFSQLTIHDLGRNKPGRF